MSIVTNFSERINKAHNEFNIIVYNTLGKENKFVSSKEIETPGVISGDTALLECPNCRSSSLNRSRQDTQIASPSRPKFQTALVKLVL